MLPRIVLVALAGFCLPGAAPPADDSSLSRERERAFTHAMALRQNRRFEDAVAPASRVLDLTRRLQPKDDQQLANLLDWYAGACELAGAFTLASRARAESYSLWEKLGGARHWRVESARLERDRARQFAALEGAARRDVLAALRAEDEAIRARGQGKPLEAERWLLGARRIYRLQLGENQLALSSVLHRLFLCRYERDDLLGARQALVEMLSLRRKVYSAFHPQLAECLNNLGLVCKDLGEVELAREHLEDTLAIRRKALPPFHPDTGDCLYNLGLVHTERRHFEAARRCLEESLEIRRKGMPAAAGKVAATLTRLALIHRQNRSHELVSACFEEVLRLRRATSPPDLRAVASALSNVGIAQADRRQFEAALGTFEEALTLRRKVYPTGHPEIAISLNNLGLVQAELRQYESARASHEEALSIRRKALPSHHPLIGQSLDNLGLALASLGKADLARKAHQEALALFRTLGVRSRGEEATALGHLASVERELGDLESARRSFEQALEIRKQLLPANHPEIATNLNNLGIALSDLGLFDLARKRLGEALAMRQRILPREHPDLAQSMNNLGVLAITSRRVDREAASGLAASVRIRLAELSRLATAQAEAEQLVAAGELRTSLDLLLSILTGTKGPEVEGAYNLVVGVKGAVTARQRWARQAREVDAETARTITRLQQLNRELFRSAMTGMGGHPEEGKRLVELQDERATLEQRLRFRSPGYRRLVEQGQRGFDAVQKALPANSALVDFFEYTHVSPPLKGLTRPTTQRRLVAFVVRPGTRGPTLVPLGSSRDLGLRITAWRELHESERPVSQQSDPGVALREMLWARLEPSLGDTRVVLTSPDGPVCGLPLAALPGTKGDTFLLHHHAFQLVPVPQLLPEMLAPRKPSAEEHRRLLLLGGVAFGTDTRSEGQKNRPATRLPELPRFAALPGSALEVRDLEAKFTKLFPGAVPPVLLRQKDASKSAFLREVRRARHLHLATHGFFARETPPTASSSLGAMYLAPQVVNQHPGLLSGLVFAGANDPTKRAEDAILTALEVAELPLEQAELVALSACETGRGKEARGEGVLGLQRAFHLAGARHVLASQWSVSDAATSVLMDRFYDNLWQKKQTPVEALRQAQLAVLEEPSRVLERRKQLRAELAKRGVSEAELRNRGLGDAVEGPPREARRSPVGWWGAWVLSGPPSDAR